MTNTNINLFENFKEIFATEFDNKKSLANIPSIVITSDEQKVKTKKFECNLKKFIKQDEKAIIEFKRLVMVECLNDMILSIQLKCNEIDNIIKSALEYSINEDLKILEYFLENSDGEKDEGHKKDISLYLYWNTEKDSYISMLEEYKKQLSKQSEKIGTNLLKCISALLLNTPLPSCFDKESTDFTNICDNAIVYFRNVEKEKNKQLSITEVNAVKKRLKTHIIEFYKKHLQFSENCTDDDTVFSKLSGGCNTEMLNKITSRIYSGSKINKKGVIIGSYNGHVACARELSAVYISYLQGEFSMDNSKK